MKKFKIVIWLLIFGFIGLVIYQNKDFFLAKKVFHLDLIARSYVTPEIPVAAVFVGFFVVGLLVTYLFAVPGRMRANKTIRSLNETIRTQSNDLTMLKSEISALKTIAPPPPDVPVTPEQDPPATPS
ncbi:MAG: LapA family protein [Pseudomonadota bacterium]